jgi:hypothetical protein
MRTKAKIDSATITVSVPLAIRKRGGRKIVLAYDGTQQAPESLRCPQVDDAMVKAIARAFRWRELLGDGSYGTITELAAAECIDHSYVGRIMRLTLFAPDIVEAIVACRPSEAIILTNLMQAVPLQWEKQRAVFG